MARFVTFPGAAGSYASTDDVNLVDADSAHFQQSIGQWASSFGFGTFALSTDMPPVFGDFHLEATATGPASFMITPTGTAGIVVSPNTQYSYKVSVATDSVVAPPLQIRVLTYDAGGSTISDTGLIDVTPSAAPDTWYTGTVTFTSDASAAFMSLGVRMDNATGDKVFVDAVCLREGGDTTFVPSIRIVGDLDVRARLAQPDWHPGFDAAIYGNFDGTPPHMIGRTSANAGEFQFQRTDTGDAERTATGTSLSLVNDTPLELKIQHDTAAQEVTFYVDNVLESTVGFVFTFGVIGDAGFVVGDRGTSTARPLTGDVYRVEMRDGIDGPIVAVFEPDDIIL